MNNILRQIELDDIVIYTENQYCTEIHNKCIDIFNKLVKDRVIIGTFETGNWMAYSGIKHYGIDYSMNSMSYESHIGKEFGLTEATMQDMLRCYAIYCVGIYIFSSIGAKIRTIISFLTCVEDKEYRITHTELIVIEDFLGFINTPNYLITNITGRIRLIKEKQKTVRKLGHIMNYLAIENEINHMYESLITDEDFVLWFPIYFWVNITFILPLRATEMLVTPLSCITEGDDKTFLKVRRTRLKKGYKTVYYDVNKDYDDFKYEIPTMKTVKNINKYQELTKNHERRFLFEYSNLCINEMFSLVQFNELLAKFINDRLMGNCNYDFAKYAVGIKEFEIVSAGDSRPIAMSNLYFQDTGADICRQLANHVNINTSAGYYTNVTETLMCSSVMQLQKRLNYQMEQGNELIKTCHKFELTSYGITCLSLKRINDSSNIEDCIEQKQLAECIGCKFNVPTGKEIDNFLAEQRKKTDMNAKKVIEFVNNTAKATGKELDVDKLFLDAHTDVSRYHIGCNIKAKEVYEEWQKHNDTQKINY